VNDDERRGTPVTKRTHENVAKIRELVQSDHLLTCRITADELDMSKETVRKISIQDLDMKKLEAKLVPRNLTKEQKGRCLTRAWTLRNKEIIFWIVSSLVMKHGVISMIPRQNASPFPQAKEATEIKVQDQNNVDLLF
jgi:hypothetical protein